MSSMYPFKSGSEGEKKETSDEFALFNDPFSKPLSAAEAAAPVMSFEQYSYDIQSRRFAYLINHADFQKNLINHDMVAEYFHQHPNKFYVVWRDPYMSKYFFTFKRCVTNMLAHGVLTITNLGLVLDFSDLGGREYPPQPCLSAIAAMLTTPVRREIADVLLAFVERDRKRKEAIRQSQSIQFFPIDMKEAQEKAQAFHNKVMKFSMPPQVPEPWEDIEQSASPEAGGPVPMELESPRAKC